MAQRSLVAAPRWMIERKPEHGAACNNCGLCCFSQRCDIGRALFGPGGRCPAVKFDHDRRSTCDVIANPQKYTDKDPDEARAAAKLLLYADHGCTMRINGEMNAEFNNRLSAFDARHADDLDRASAFWNIKRELPF